MQQMGLLDYSLLLAVEKLPSVDVSTSNSGVSGQVRQRMSD